MKRHLLPGIFNLSKNSEQLTCYQPETRLLRSCISDQLCLLLLWTWLTEIFHISRKAWDDVSLPLFWQKMSKPLIIFSDCCLSCIRKRLYAFMWLLCSVFTFAPANTGTATHLSPLLDSCPTILPLLYHVIHLPSTSYTPLHSFSAQSLLQSKFNHQPNHILFTHRSRKIRQACWAKNSR